MDKKEKIDISFSLVDFQIEKFETNQPPGKLTKKSKGNFSFNSKLEIDDEKNYLVIYFKVESIVLFRKKEYRLSKIETKTSFYIDNLKKFVKDKKITLPKQFMATVYAIAYSTTRGALVALGRGVSIKNPIMPAIPINKLLPPQEKN